jgi:hypothetical protein
MKNSTADDPLVDSRERRTIAGKKSLRSFFFYAQSNPDISSKRSSAYGLQDIYSAPASSVQMLSTWHAIGGFPWQAGSAGPGRKVAGWHFTLKLLRYHWA